MSTSERRLYDTYRKARAGYDAAPNWATASEVLRAATALVALSDDYAGEFDEPCDIMAEPEAGT